MSTPQPTVSLWAKTVFWWTFGHNSSKNNDTDVFDGSLEAYYESRHEKMTKFEIWVIIGDWSQIAKFSNFRPKSS